MILLTMINLLIREPILFKLPITAMRFIKHARHGHLATPCMTWQEKVKRLVLDTKINQFQLLS